MIFSSLSFSIFFILFFFLYWFIFNSNIKLQNLLILAGSYFFYAWWDWRLLFILFTFSLLNFILGICIDKAATIPYKRLFLWLGLIAGIGGLLFFKYFNFFIDPLNAGLDLLKFKTNLQTLHIIVPLGISFFTFRAISYLLEIEKGKIKPTYDIIVFLNYISFFPCVLSGPIDKAKLFIPQLEKKRVFDADQSSDAMCQILWGLFKKLVIADNCTMITAPIFNDYATLPASSLLLGAFFYTIQIYADFSGYSDMAIGFSRLLGFNITRNFDFPFFSQNIAAFWRKWHISLTTWLTEYVFTPLNIAFRDWGNTGLFLAIIINFTLIGLWHGPNLTYVLFGFLHGCYFIPLIISGSVNKRKNIAKDKMLPSFIESINILMTFLLIMLTFVIFRTDNILQALHYYSRLFSFSLFNIPVLPSGKLAALTTLFFIGIMLIVEWMQRDKEHGLQSINIKSVFFRFSIYYLLIFAIILFGSTSENPFIYFKF